ncbi:MAG TPA: carbon-nitrogen hydrolase family protein, partial [Candidatus Thermoplasmatota archaeon]|nr:carbon-nitrogen hydrolase family protein [Candidatus Thermoplasmatota archaeon]
SYAKTHVHWSEAFEPGTDFPVVRAFRVPLGMLICFDAAFPEVPRTLALRGAQIIVNISAIPESFPLKHVHRRVVACSVDNQVFTVFANRAGPGFRGGSMVVDPTGDVLGVAGEAGDLTVDVDLDAVERWRKEEPLFAHRRPHLYRDIAQ